MTVTSQLYFGSRIVYKMLFLSLFFFAISSSATCQEVDFCETPNLTIEELNEYVDKDWFEVLQSEVDLAILERKKTYKILQEKASTDEEVYSRIVLYVWYAKLSNKVEEFEDTNRYFHQALSLALQKNSHRYIYFVTINYVRHLKANKIYQPAQKMLEELLDIFKHNCNDADLVHALRVMELLSDIAKETGDWDQSTALQEKIILLEEGQGKSFKLSNYYNNLGYLHLKQLQNIERAESYFDKALETLLSINPSKNPTKDTLAMSNIRENLAHVYIKKKQFKKAENYYVNAQKYREQLKKKSIRAKLYLAELYLNHYPEPVFQDYVRGLLLTYKDNHHLIINSDKLKLSKLLKKYAKKSTQEDLKNDAFDLSFKLFKSFYEEKSKSQISFSKSYFSTIQKDAAEKLQVESQLLENEKRNGFLSKIILTLLSILIAGILIIFRIFSTRVKTQKRNQEIKAELIEMKLKQSKLELEANKSLLDNIKSDNLVKNQLLKTWLKELKEIASTKEILNIKKHVKSLILNVNERLNDTSAYNHIIESLNDASPLFQKKLVNRFPNLTKREIQFCLLLHLDRSRSEIMSLMHVNLNAYKSTQNRIRRKMQLDRSVTLKEYIESF